MTLNTKSKIFLCLALLLTLFTGVIFQQYRLINARLSDTLMLLDNVYSSVHQIEREMLNDPPNIALMKNITQNIPADIKDLQEKLLSKYKPSIFVDLEITFVRLKRIVDRSLPGTTLELPLMKQIRNETFKIEQAVQALLIMTHDKHDQLRDRAELLIVIVYCTFIAFLFGIIVFMARLIVRPIVMISKEIEQLGAGKREEISSLARTDEIGTLNEFIRKVIAELAQKNKVLQGEISERKQTEEKLRQSSMTLENVLDNSNPICITNLNFEVLQANKAYYSIWPTEETKKQRQKCYDSRPGSLCHTDSCPLKQILSGNEEVTVESQKTEKSGKEDYFIITARAFRDEHGELLGIVESFQDITERIHMERKLLESETRFRQLAENIGEIFWMTSVDGQEMIYVSPAYEEIWGRSCESLYQNPMSRIENIHPESRDDFVDTLHRSPENGGFDVTYRIIRSDKTERWIRDRGFPVLNENNTIYRIAGIAEDITALQNIQNELRHAKESAEKANRAKSVFLANMSHEIRTPLNVIIGMNELLKESELSAEQKQYLKILALNSETLLYTINDIIDLSKVDAGRVELEQVELNLCDLLEDTAEMLAFKAHEKGLELHTVLAPEIPLKLTGDQTRLRQILVNLIGNAIKFTAQGEIIMKCMLSKPVLPEDNEVELLFSVLDTGIGVPADKLEAIFERFSQADTSTTREFGGTGLGLTISKMLCELMGGEMWVESDAEQGSTFSFTCKLAKSPGAMQNINEQYTPLHNVKIIIVDGNNTRGKILQEILQGWQVTVDVAADSTAAMDYAKKAVQQNEPYNYALLNCQLPGKDGFQLAKYFQKTYGEKTVTGLMLTADERRKKPERYLNSGIKVCLIKPVKRADLYAFLSKVTVESKTITPVDANTVHELLLPDMNRLEPMTILLAEDFVHNCLVVQQYLKNTHFKLDIAENGAQAVEKFKIGAYDLILMDIEMPIKDGYTATREIRLFERESGRSPTPIIALSAYALKKEMDRSIEAGCNEHLTKPLKKAVLLQALVKYGKALPESNKKDDDTAGLNSESDVLANNSQKEEVRLDKDFAELIPKFLEYIEGSIDQMREELTQQDYTSIRKNSHRIKGAGGGYGLDKVSDLALALETAAKEKNQAAISLQLEKLAEYLQHIDIKYE